VLADSRCEPRPGAAAARGPEWSLVENRREPRSFCDGEVRLVLDDPDAREIVGEMVDVSNQGFRASHRDWGIAFGREVRFTHRFFRGRARVVWSRALDGLIESGFAILRD
jgi:hypothetical protein